MKLDFFKKSDKPIKREREKHITRLHIILFSLVVITTIVVLVTLKVTRDRKIARYRKIEDDLRIATIYYFADKTNSLDKGQRKVVTMKTVIDKGYLQDDVTNDCIGYTIISNNRNLDGEYEIGYESYIKCGNDYQSDSFIDDYAKQVK